MKKEPVLALNNDFFLNQRLRSNMVDVALNFLNSFQQICRDFEIIKKKLKQFFQSSYFSMENIFYGNLMTIWYRAKRNELPRHSFWILSISIFLVCFKLNSLRFSIEYLSRTKTSPMCENKIFSAFFHFLSNFTKLCKLYSVFFKLQNRYCSI